MSVFNFKRFAVVNECSAMKVNTDGVLLGAAMTVKDTDRNLLDVGTGTGTIALMAAQRLCDLSGNSAMETLKIDAIDIDEASAAEAAANFSSSPWSAVLHAENCSLEAFAASGRQHYDLIFSNPPYFECPLSAPEDRRSTARHTNRLSYRELSDFAAKKLTPEGRLAIVLPAEQEKDLLRHARMNGLYLFRILRIRTVPRKAPCRMIVEFSRIRILHPVEESLTIQNEGKYTDEYLGLTHDFYLFA